MSVINQMLKDLDKRAPEQGQAPITIVAHQKSSTLKVILISVAVLLCLNALGFYIWNLQEQVAQSRTENATQTLVRQPTESTQLEVISPKSEARSVLNQSTESNQQEVISPKSVTQTVVSQSKESIQQEITRPKNVTQTLVSKPIDVIPQDVTSPKNLARTEVRQSTESIQQEVSKSKMSVSRRQLSPKELIARKLEKAEKLISLNELTKAEQLFEDVLIIKPEHKEARKKLAALWFGRKTYQQAVNLLSQGIAIDMQDGELRMLKARILLKQGQHKAAYHTLKPLVSLENEEYQVMLANIAQQTGNFSSAISAYQMLIKMQPYSGRWHLGLAITYDKDGQFLLAINEYGLALTKANLSASSAEFAEQRMQALGE